MSEPDRFPFLPLPSGPRCACPMMRVWRYGYFPISSTTNTSRSLSMGAIRGADAASRCSELRRSRLWQPGWSLAHVRLLRSAPDQMHGIAKLWCDRALPGHLRGDGSARATIICATASTTRATCGTCRRPMSARWSPIASRCSASGLAASCSGWFGPAVSGTLRTAEIAAAARDPLYRRLLPR